MFGFKLPSPPVSQDKAPEDKFALVGSPGRELQEALRTLNRLHDTPPILTRAELALLGLSPAALCISRTLKPMPGNVGPERYGLTAFEVAQEVLGSEGKDATRPLARALDFACAVRQRNEGYPKCLALAPGLNHFNGGPQSVLLALVPLLDLSPACLRPILEELAGDDPGRIGGRELATRLLTETAPDAFLGKVAVREAVPLLAKVLASPQPAPVLVALLDLVRMLPAPRDLQLWRAIRHLEQHEDSAVREAADHALFVLG